MAAIKRPHKPAHTTLDAAVLDAQAGAGRVRKRQQLARGHRGIDQLASHHL
jgi:hypothetical protein